ncbi:hypothetical protein BJ508DRAFT_335872 [Ascobolus immersus RN42]|uniref:Nephrocystin 3-like N-terminal domain-containing protein n=1 Tax=Ascobolus immersus RN42 TaxID=1160509 RepID=A0A3N4HHX0_ASCIM|nr:hypothetical protein BJ508DRAFT_335872 [Ascobolus immersus RN42]
MERPSSRTSKKSWQDQTGSPKTGKARTIRIQEVQFQGYTSHGRRSYNLTVKLGSLSHAVLVHDPFDAEQHKRLAWALEKHAKKAPFEAHRASELSEELSICATSLMDQLKLKDMIESVRVEGKSRARWYVDVEASTISDHDMVHGIHWEVLELPNALPTGIRNNHQIIVRRKVPMMGIPSNLDSIPIKSTTFNILLVVSHVVEETSDGSKQHNPRLISRPLAELLAKISKESGKVTVNLEIVRPGTWKALCEHLERREKGYFHLVHFDVRGKISDETGGREEASLAFMSDKYVSQRSWRTASEVAALLSCHNVKFAVVNAPRSCRAFGVAEPNLAQTLVNSGVRAVVSFPFKTLDAALDRFISTFYADLFTSSWDFAVATNTARRVLMRERLRSGKFGTDVRLDDWIIPVVYHNGGTQIQLEGEILEGQIPATRASFLSRFGSSNKVATIAKQDDTWILKPKTFGDGKKQISDIFLTRGTMVGRDLEIFELESRMLLETNSMQLRGAPGCGKSTLAVHLCWWWKTTGLIKDYFFFDYYMRPSLSLDSILQNIYASSFPRPPAPEKEAKVKRNKSDKGKPDRGVKESKDKGQKSPVWHLTHWRTASQDAPATHMFPEGWQEALIKHLRDNRYLIVLDSLESSLIDVGASVDEKQAMNEFLMRLAGGKTMVLVISNNVSGNCIDRKIASMGTYDLQKMSCDDAILLTRAFVEKYGGNLKNFDGEENVWYLRQVLKLLDYNPLLLEHTLPAIVKENRSTKQLYLHMLQGSLALGTLQSAALYAVKSMRMIADLIEVLDDQSRRLLLCLAPFWTVLPRDIDAYFALLVYNNAIPSAVWKESFDVVKDLKVGRNQIDHIRLLLRQAGILGSYEQLLRSLEGLDLLIRHETYYEMHPLLTVFLRQTVSREKENDEPGQVFDYRAVTKSFIEFHEHRAQHWSLTPDDTYHASVLAIREETTNFISAISLAVNRKETEESFISFPIHTYGRLAAMSLVDKNVITALPTLQQLSELVMARFAEIKSHKPPKKVKKQHITPALLVSNWLVQLYAEQNEAEQFKSQIEMSLAFIQLCGVIDKNILPELSIVEEQMVKIKAHAVFEGLIEGIRLKKPWSNFLWDMHPFASRVDDLDMLLHDCRRLHSVGTQAHLTTLLKSQLSSQLRKDLLVHWSSVLKNVKDGPLEKFLPSFTWVTDALTSEMPITEVERKKRKLDRIFRTSPFLAYADMLRSVLHVNMNDIDAAKKTLWQGVERCKSHNAKAQEMVLRQRLLEIYSQEDNWKEVIHNAEWILEFIFPGSAYANEVPETPETPMVSMFKMPKMKSSSGAVKVEFTVEDLPYFATILYRLSMAYSNLSKPHGSEHYGRLVLNICSYLSTSSSYLNSETSLRWMQIHTERVTGLEYNTLQHLSTLPTMPDSKKGILIVRALEIYHTDFASEFLPRKLRGILLRRFTNLMLSMESGADKKYSSPEPSPTGSSGTDVSIAPFSLTSPALPSVAPPLPPLLTQNYIRHRNTHIAASHPFNTLKNALSRMAELAGCDPEIIDEFLRDCWEMERGIVRGWGDTWGKKVWDEAELWIFVPSSTNGGYNGPSRGNGAEQGVFWGTKWEGGLKGRRGGL